MTQAAEKKQRKEREPICGLCWMLHRYIPLHYIVEEDVWYCPQCGRRTYEPPPDDEEDAIAQAFYAQEGYEEGLPGRPPWRSGITGPVKGGRSGSKSGRRKKTPKKSTPWYRLYGET